MSDHRDDGVDSWTETMTARERIRAVAETLREPRSTSWVSEQADAAWSTTSDELARLVEEGRVRRLDADGSTLYEPDYAWLLLDEIRTLIEENTRAELREELTAITEEIENWQSAYDCETWEELEQSLGDRDLSSDELRERRDVIVAWRENEADRRLLDHALSLYSDVDRARNRDATDHATG